jgi:hypothetical protein
LHTALAGFVIVGGFWMQCLAETSGGPVFEQPKVASIEIELDEAGWQTLSNPKTIGTYVPARFKHEGEVLEEVGVRLKGRRTFQVLERKPSFAVKFNEFRRQTFGGLTKILLNNSTTDPTYLREYVANQMYLQAGVPAPRVGHARVKLNGTNLGFYVMVEGINKVFLGRHFYRSNGNLYEGSTRDIDGQLEQDGGSDAGQADIKALCEVTKEIEPARRWTRLGELLDMKRFLSFLAMEQLTGQVDGYATAANNYRIYHDPDAERMVVFPHGLDFAFVETNVSVYPLQFRLLAKAALRTHEGRRAYRQRMEEVFAGVYDTALITNRAWRAAEALGRAAHSDKEEAIIMSNAVALCSMIAQRQSHFAAALKQSELQLPPFDESGTAVVAGWHGSAGSGIKLGESVVDERKALWIDAREGFGTASFRARVLVDPGKYSFRGDVRLAGVESRKPARPLPELMLRRLREGGVRLCASGIVNTNFVVGESGWTEYRYDFDVDYGPQEVELVCELNRSKGRVWFDEQSLRLVRR